MPSKDLLKRIILENLQFIKALSLQMVPREGLVLPEGVRKVVVLYGLRRSGKTYMLYSLFKEAPDASLYVDFEDDRLAGFSPADFENLREAL